MCPSASTLHGRISWSIFTKIGTDVRTTKRKNEFVRGQYRTTPSLILPHNPPPKVLKPMKILSYPIPVLNICESPKFSRHKGNRGRGTRWWRQISNRKWKYGRFTQAQWKNSNIALIYGRIAKMFSSFRKYGSRNNVRFPSTAVFPLPPEVEIRPFRACAMHPAIIIGTVRSLWRWLCGRYHVPQNVFIVLKSILTSWMKIMRTVTE